MENGKPHIHSYGDTYHRLYVAAFFIFIIYMLVDFVDYFLPIYRLVCLVSMCALLYSAGCIHYKKDKSDPQKMLFPIFWVMFGLYVHLLAVFTILDPLLGRGNGAVYHSVENITREFFNANYLNLIPFNSIINVYFANIFSFGANSLDYAMNFFGNLFAYMPMAFFVPMFFRRTHKWWAFTSVIVVAVGAVELIQYIQMAGSCDIDDIILNAGGALIAYFITKIPKITHLLDRFSFGLFSGLPSPYTPDDGDEHTPSDGTSVIGGDMSDDGDGNGR